MTDRIDTLINKLADEVAAKRMSREQAWRLLDTLGDIEKMLLIENGGNVRPKCRAAFGTVQIMLIIGITVSSFC